MAYRITGLAPESFARLFALDDAALAAQGAMRVIADADRGYPCRVSLQDARKGETLLLLHHVSHDVKGPFRTAYAIYVREAASQAATFVDGLPPVFEGRALSLRGFDGQGMLRGALLAAPEEVDASIRALFADAQIATIHAHNAAYGCFAALVERDRN
jgi:hypothetical protein